MRAHGFVLTRSVLFLLAWGACAAALFAGGAREIETKITLQRPAAYISPAGPEGAVRSLEIKDIALQISKGGSIKRYDFVVYDKAGAVVYSKTAVQTQGKGFLGEAFNVGSVPVSLPAAISWGGVDKDGTVLADGEYFYQLTAVDSWDFPASAAPLAVVIDSVPPAIRKLAAVQALISPDGDGRQDTLRLAADTDRAARWVADVTDPSGAVVWTRTTLAPGDTERTDVALPAEIAWDPLLDPSGAPRAVPLPDGEYHYKVTGYDRAGNFASAEAVFRISSGGAAIAVSAADGRTVTAADRDYRLAITLADTADASRWSLEIADSKGVVWRKYTGSGAAPESLVFRGRGMAGKPEADDDRLPDGLYSVLARQEYASGFIASDDAFRFSMDSTPPAATLVMDTAERATNPAINPWFGGASRAWLDLRLATSEALEWQMVVADYEGVLPTRVFPLAAVASPDPVNPLLWTARWDGGLPAGTILESADGSAPAALEAPESLPDGRWVLSVRASDPAGNTGGSQPLSFVRRATVGQAEALLADTAELAPGVAGAAGQAAFTLPGLEQAAVEKVTLQLRSEAGEAVFRQEYRPGLPLAWQGQFSSGLPAPNGRYRPEVLIDYRNGDSQGLQGEWLLLAGRGEQRVVTESPNAIIARAISMTVNTPILLDQAAGPAVPVAFTVRNAHGFPGSLAWTLKVLDPAGATVWTASGSGSPAEPIRWDGARADGGYIPALERFRVVWEMTGPALDGTVTVESAFMTGIPVAAENGRTRVVGPDILFQGNNPDPFDGDAAQIAVNIDLLRRLGDRLAQLENRQLVIEGYANYAGRLTPAAMEVEQRTTLIPLSRQRAHEVRKAFFALGIDWDRLVVVAKGGDDPVAPYGDKTVAWKNRRVIMYLD